MNTDTRNRPSRGGSKPFRQSSSRPTSKKKVFSSSPKRRGAGSAGSRFGNSSFRNSGGGAPNRSRFNQGRPTGRGGRKMPSFDPSRFINTNPVDTEEEVYTPKNDFGTFGLSTRLVETVHNLGIKVPSPIQDQIIPEILNNKDVIGLAETGTGKTAAFLLPLIEKTAKDKTRQTLILAPTRELAIQIEDELKKLSKGFKIFSVTCVGGINIRPQIRALSRTNHFIIGTPGRILDLIRQKKFITSGINTVVLDEADRMLDMGFIADIRSILSTTPKDRETLFFSATMTEEAKKLVNDFLIDPVTISVKKKDTTNSIVQDVVIFQEDKKFNTLLKLLKTDGFDRIIIFSTMKHSAEKLSKSLIAEGIKSESIHGNKSHGQRQRSLKAFKDGNAKVLVATDVAARGIHVDNVSHVINYDLPGTFEDYVHRIGRTGRGTKRGKALTFVPKR